MQGDSNIPPNPSLDSESLVKRLAGASTTKAGLAKDQSEINRIIAEASRGSKFHENEKRKDKDLTERIARILRQRDEVLRGVDLRSVEQGVDQILVKLESHRDLTRTIVHVDMDAFYASVELLDNPALEGKPFAVGHGILTTASYEARKYGARSGMPSFIAKKLCPDLILVENHFHRYMTLSKQVMDIFRRYDPNMCAAGCDEGYLNITPYCEDHQLSAEQCVQQMRDAVFRETKLTVSAGIAPNKMLAKICSDKNKPNGQFKLEFDSRAIKAFMHELSIRKVPGVGRVNERLLDSIGIKTCGDIYTHRAIVSLMDKQFGLRFLLQAYLGIASNVVQPGQREERKSIGAERLDQHIRPIGDQEMILQKLDEIAAELEGDMTNGGWTGKTVTLKYKLDTYQVFTRAKSFDRWISGKKEDLFVIGKELLMPELPLTIRLIGLRVTKLKDLKADGTSQSSGIKRFFESAQDTDPARKRRRVDETEHDGDGEPSLSQDGFEEAMPGYHEHAESDERLPQTSGDVSRPEQPVRAGIGTEQRPRPPMSAPAPSVSSGSNIRPSKPVSGPIKLHSARRAPTAPPAPVALKSGTVSPSLSSVERLEQESEDNAQLQTCPICGKSIRTDNQGLNAHIDFCLSKEAIREAQASSSVSVSPKGFRVGDNSISKKNTRKEARRKKKK